MKAAALPLLSFLPSRYPDTQSIESAAAGLIDS
jgi:hypothetical protein